MRILNIIGVASLFIAVLLYAGAFGRAFTLSKEGVASLRTETAILRGEMASLRIEANRLQTELKVKVDDPQRRREEEFQEVVRLLESGEENGAESLAYFVVDKTGGRLCPEKGVRFRDNDRAFPQVIRDTFFRGNGRYVIQQEGEDGAMVVICH